MGNGIWIPISSLRLPSGSTSPIRVNNSNAMTGDTATHHVLVFDETLLISAEVYKEEDGSHVLEAVYPFPAFGLLTADVDDQHGSLVVKLEGCLSDSGSAYPAVEDVLLCRTVRFIEKPIEVCVEVHEAV